LLAGAGLTAFILGFAMKDIGENFLSGIVLVFNRPFRTNDIIEQDGFIGRVVSVSLRETVIKSLDGKDIYIPNADILKKPLQNYTIDNLIRTSFRLWIFNSNNLPEVLEFIRLEVSKSPHIQKKTPPRILTENFENGLVQIRVNYWYSLKGTRIINNDLQSMIMTNVFEALKAKGVGMPDHVQDIKINS
jgi:small conductance mechanosensitive channel